MAEKLYYRIGEVARKFNVQPTLIRYWEKEFDFIKPHKSDKGTRMFTQKDLERFEIVYHLVKEKGLTIQGTRDYFKKHYDSQSLDKFKDTKELLDSQLGDLGGITLKYYIKETKLGGENSDSVIYIFARVDPFKYFSFTDTIFATEPERVKNFSEKIVAAASSKYPAQTIIAVIGFTNLAFYSTVPDIYGEDYTQYSKNEGGWRVERLYAAARGMDGKITDTWLEAGRAS